MVTSRGRENIFLEKKSDRPVGETIAFRVIRFDYEVILDVLRFGTAI